MLRLLKRLKSMLPRYKYLLSYRYAEIVHDGTVEFCRKFLSDLSSLSYLRTIPTRRTIDQMVQAARSGKQNIVEGVEVSQTSKKGEIKLLGVAKASIEELITDYEDFLRQRKLEIWPKYDRRIENFRKIGFRLSHISNLSRSGELREKLILPKIPEEAANILLTLCHQTSYLLDRQIVALEKKFEKEGGFTEKLYNMRTKYRKSLK